MTQAQVKYAGTAVADPMTPVLFEVGKIKRELSDTFTLELISQSGNPFSFKPGQFTMLYQFGVGEVPISISGDPLNPSKLTHTIRAVGKVTEAMMRLKKGDMVGVRGPFGTNWPVEAAEGSDVVIITGGVGLAPLRPAIYHLLANRKRYGNICIYYGARTPEDILFRKQLEKWRGRFDLKVEVTVDRALAGWNGRVGVVTKLLDLGGFDADQTVAMVCGPEVMMRFSVRALNELGVRNDSIYVSMERNMKCAVGFCGHCQYGSAFVCKDGPVFPFSDLEEIFDVREL
ncbi:MAG: FAD/NAD(P)-binding protein [Rhodospirillales bacterium]|nr:FAD/NAD(P)-binding protein [Rhodospirillales bacterium]